MKGEIAIVEFIKEARNDTETDELGYLCLALNLL